MYLSDLSSASSPPPCTAAASASCPSACQVHPYFSSSRSLPFRSGLQCPSSERPPVPLLCLMHHHVTCSTFVSLLGCQCHENRLFALFPQPQPRQPRTCSVFALSGWGVCIFPCLATLDISTCNLGIRLSVL